MGMRVSGGTVRVAFKICEFVPMFVLIVRWRTGGAAIAVLATSSSSVRSMNAFSFGLAEVMVTVPTAGEA